MPPAVGRYAELLLPGHCLGAKSPESKFAAHREKKRRTDVSIAGPTLLGQQGMNGRYVTPKSFGVETAGVRLRQNLRRGFRSVEPGNGRRKRRIPSFRTLGRHESDSTKRGKITCTDSSNLTNWDSPPRSTSTARSDNPQSFCDKSPRRRICRSKQPEVCRRSERW
jgi:hypothetical protein